MATILVGIILVSLQLEAWVASTGYGRLVVVLSLGAALGFGLYYVLIAQGVGVSSASPLWIVIGARGGSLALLLLLQLSSQQTWGWPSRHGFIVLAVGLLDTIANVLFAYAAHVTTIEIVSFLGSLYLIAIVFSSHVVLKERLKVRQHGSVVLALTGVALIVSG